MRAASATLESRLSQARAAMARGEYLASIGQAESVLADPGATPGVRARAHLLRAMNASNRGLPAEGLLCAEASIADGTVAGELDVVAQSLAVKGDCHAALEQVDEALSALRGATVLLNPEMPPQVRRTIHTGIALAYRSLGFASMAIESCRHALQLASGEGSVEAWVRAWTNLANAAGDRWQALAPIDPAAARALPQEVLAHRAELINATQASDMRRLRIAVHVSTSRLLLAAECYQTAREAVHEALALAPEIGWEYRRDWCIDLARAERALGNDADARRALAVARELADANAGARLGIQSTYRMAELAALEGDANQVWRWARQHHARVARREHAALQSRVDELAASVQQKTLSFGVTALRREREQLQDNYRRMRDLASKDALTGLLNRRFIRAEFEARPSGDLYLGLFDIDHFKGVNDRFGHPVGDLVLQQVAQVMSAKLRRHDVLGRYGGEEFVVLLVGAGEQGCDAAARRVREGLQCHRWSDIVDGLAITLSGGIVAVQPGEDFDAAVARADVLLYEAKAAGRDRVLTDHRRSAEQ